MNEAQMDISMSQQSKKQQINANQIQHEGGDQLIQENEVLDFDEEIPKLNDTGFVGNLTGMLKELQQFEQSIPDIQEDADF